MTKLSSFLVNLIVGAGIWLVLVQLFYTFNDTFYFNYVILPLPIWVLIGFGIYSASIVLYRTMTFNDCPDAAKELVEQIDEARTDLKKKGMKSI